jgi:hypothetical protein
MFWNKGFIAVALVFAVAFSTTAEAAQEKATVYDCQVKDFKGKGWIAPRVIVSLAPDGKSAAVYDGIIHEVYGAPLMIKVKPRDEKSVILNWRVNDIPAGNMNTKEHAQYSAILYTKKHELSVTAQLSYFDNEPRGRGKCEVSRK